MSEPQSINHSSAEHADAKLRLTPLNALHRELGAKLVPFAGYEMPLQYAAGIVKEHNHVRAAAGLFDVSHMGQARLCGPDFETAAAAIEALAPADILSLKPGRIRYTQLLNAQGGVIDDLMVTRSRDGAGLSLIVNASRQEIDFAHIRAGLPAGIELTPQPERALVALQGPKAAAVLSRVIPGVEHLCFMESGAFHVKSEPVQSRARATPGRTVSKSPSQRPPLKTSRANCSRSPKSSPSASARAIRSGLRRACRSTVRTWMKPPRRLRPGSPSPSASAGGPKAAFRAPRALSVSFPRGLPACALASSSKAGPRREPT